MKFLLNVYAGAAAGPALPGARRHPPPADADFVAAARESGELVDSQLVADPSTSAVVRVRDGVVTVVEGPYDGTSPQLAAYYLVDCEDRERALELAAAIPAAHHDAVEVRPVMLASGPEL